MAKVFLTTNFLSVLSFEGEMELTLPNERIIAFKVRRWKKKLKKGNAKKNLKKKSQKMN